MFVILGIIFSVGGSFSCITRSIIEHCIEFVSRCYGVPNQRTC